MISDSSIEQKPLTVSAAMGLAKGALEQITITLVGEVSEVNNKAGYKAVYFTVKDEKASMPCMMWMNKFKAAGVPLEVGALVQITGRFTLYAPKGRMNFDVFSLSLAGEGTLRQQVAERARRLKAEGLMDQSRKRALPEYPQKIGLVTSPRGAAVHDVLRTLRRRWPEAEVLFAGIPVEGATAPSSLVEGLACVAGAGAQVILLVRGGGSFEDLMPFNDEELARAIAYSPVPVVTGIGHEPDTSIADMVADYRASTPTAAAEAVSPDGVELDMQLISALQHMRKSMTDKINRTAMHVDHIASRPLFADPLQLFATEAQTLDYTEDRLHRAIPGGILRDAQLLQSYTSRLATSAGSALSPYESAFSLAASRLEDLSPLTILSRGYSMTRTESGELVKSYQQAPEGSTVVVSVADGDLTCKVEAANKRDTIQSSRKE